MNSTTTAEVHRFSQPPKVYRAMKFDPADDLPVVGPNSSSELGVRPGGDVTVDPAGNVVRDGSGMSVAPGWRVLPFTRIPKRLRSIVPGAAGANNTACFTMGTGTFTQGALTRDLELIPDKGNGSVTHGVIAPIRSVSADQFQTCLANTRAAWRIDES